VEVYIMQHFFVANLHMQVFDMQHRTIVENMAITALNAFQATKKCECFSHPLTDHQVMYTMDSFS
jgi:hypothetical protein